MEGTVTTTGSGVDRARGLIEVEPRVSVVIPTYNRAPSLQRLLGAIRAGDQPSGGMEIIVVDDGSNDGTAAVAEAAGVHYLRQPNFGPAAARERGWRAAEGDVIVFLDDDVIPEPNTIVELVRATEDVSGAGALILPLDVASVTAHYMHADGLVNHRIVDGGVRWLITAAAAFRRDALERIGGFDLSFPRAAGEDVDLTLRLLEAGCTLRVEERAAVRHDHCSGVAGLWKTCYRYGSAYKLLADRHDSHRLDRHRSALLRLSPVEWARLYRAYHRQTSWRRSVAFVGMHLFVVLPYGLGALAGTFSERGVELQGHAPRRELQLRAQQRRVPAAPAAEEGAPAA